MADEMGASGLAYRYFGGFKTGWVLIKSRGVGPR
jgi:hypothetical protein